MTDTRHALRRRLRESRASLPAMTRLSAAEGVARTLGALPMLEHPGYVAGYWAIGGELPLHAVIGRLLNGSVYCLPRLAKDGRLRFAPWRPGDSLVTNRYGIPEPDVSLSACLLPEELHLVLMPLLGFDRRGHRLGMGGGWYDRSFAGRSTRPAPPWLIGIGYACQELELVPEAEWDVPLDYIATERELIVCHRA